MASRIFAFFIWAAVAASLAYWGLRWVSKPTPVPANATLVSVSSAAHGDLRRLLSGPAKAASAAAVPGGAAELAARFKLIGLVAPQEGQSNGVALLSIDGKPPRAVRLGGLVDGDLVLQKLSQRSADIGPPDGGAAVTLELPALPVVATGTLPAVSGFVRSNVTPPVSIEGRPLLDPALPVPATPPAEQAPGTNMPAPNQRGRMPGASAV